MLVRGMCVDLVKQLVSILGVVFKIMVFTKEA